VRPAEDHHKVERFHRTSSMTGACVRLCRMATPERNQTFTRWLRFDQHRRPHIALDGLTPMAVLINNADGNTPRGLADGYAVELGC
jgi:transposase InsO family protein